MRLRVRFAKTGKVRFVGHRDVARIWERSLRKASLSVAYSEGFSPRPKLSFGLALSTGYESNAEYLEIELLEPADDSTWSPVDAEAMRVRIDAVLPAGFDVLAGAPA
ncbi:MAG TPA: TIGR03936 family radical SAM-associated protein, partial [Acidimicrobiales bacterium]|nr:TIGR03936 family radical SAM-associated protein [Acidimicrobiales bacterium]